MLAELHEHDPDLAALPVPAGAVLVSPGLQGRIFCEIGGDLIHRLDTGLLDHPLPDEFNNLGGNSLWPAPEGGAYAFNYPPDSDEWLVQDGIAAQAASLTSADARSATLQKTIELTNRKGRRIRLLYERRVELADNEMSAAPAGAESVAYRSGDTFEPLEDYSPDDVLLAPWSLEQFPGGDGVVAFAKVEQPETSINLDFYGMPESRPVYGSDFFTLALGGTAKFQLGVKVANRPALLGALDRRRSLLFLRTTPRQDGVYFNIADNDQPDGPWSAADMYSVFNGGDLDFFELETIGAMQLRNGHLARSTLVSTTVILRAPLAVLTGYLSERCGIAL